MPPSVLIVDDDANLLHGLCRTLRDQPYNVLTARSAEEALPIVQSRPIAVIVCDEQMAGQPGTRLLAWIARSCPEVVRIAMTGAPTAQTAARAVNEGQVFRFFSKPFPAVDLAMAIRDGIDYHAANHTTMQPVGV